MLNVAFLVPRAAGIIIKKRARHALLNWSNEFREELKSSSVSAVVHCSVKHCFRFAQVVFPFDVHALVKQHKHQYNLESASMSSLLVCTYHNTGYCKYFVSEVKEKTFFHEHVHSFYPSDG